MGGSPSFWVPSFLSFLSFWARCGPPVVTRFYSCTEQTPNRVGGSPPAKTDSEKATLFKVFARRKAAPRPSFSGGLRLLFFSAYWACFRGTPLCEPLFGGLRRLLVQRFSTFYNFETPAPIENTTMFIHFCSQQYMREVKPR